MLLLALLAVPIVFGVAVFFWGKNRITYVELAIQLVLAGALVVGGYYLTRWGGIQDTELWNGRIASTPTFGSNCCHSYKCNCRQECTESGNNKQRTCKEVCSTCYEHAGDTTYAAVTSNGEEVFRSGCWGPGQGPPTAWSRIRIGEPTVVEHRFTNYIKADPSGLVAESREGFEPALLDYPRVVGWRARRILLQGVTLDPVELARLESALDELNADLGAAKQVNVIVVVAAQASPDYFDALAHHWLGGKKNDVVLVIGAPAFPALAWARVMAWNKASGGEDELKGGIAARVLALGRFDGDAVLGILRDEVSRNYQRRSFTEFEYLLARARPPVWAVITLFVVGLALSSILHYFFWRNRSRLKGRAPHERVRGSLARLRTWWRARTAAPVAHDAGAPPPTPVPAPAPTPAAEPPLTPATELRVSVQTVEAVCAIPGADRIEQLEVAGRTVVAPKGMFRPGDRCVFFMPGCVLPDRPWSQPLRKRKFYVEAREIRGVRSDGFVVPVATVFPGDAAIPLYRELAAELEVELPEPEAVP